MVFPDGSPQNKVVNASTTQATLTGLNEYTNYSITLFVFTVKGGGKLSKPIIVITDEDSKFFITNLVYMTTANAVLFVFETLFEPLSNSLPENLVL